MTIICKTSILLQSGSVPVPIRVAATMSSRIGRNRLLKEYRDLTTNPPEGVTAGPISEHDLYKWEALLLGPDDTPFEGGCFRAELTFPHEFPLRPPKMHFKPPIWHPNVYSDGRVCISILHAGQDQYGYEKAEERWSPVQTIEKILLSVLSMLADPNDESPANVDAAKMWRENRSEYEERVRNNVRISLGFESNMEAKNSGN